MLLLVLEIAMLVYGIIAVSTGRFSLSAQKEARGVPARIAGVLLILPLPVAFLVGFMVGAAMAAQGRAFDIQHIPPWITFMELGIFAVFAISAFVVAGVNAQPVQKYAPPKPPYDDYPEEERQRPPHGGYEDQSRPQPPDDRYRP